MKDCARKGFLSWTCRTHKPLSTTFSWLEWLTWSHLTTQLQDRLRNVIQLWAQEERTTWINSWPLSTRFSEFICRTVWTARSWQLFYPGSDKILRGSTCSLWNIGIYIGCSCRETPAASEVTQNIKRFWFVPWLVLSLASEAIAVIPLPTVHIFKYLDIMWNG